MDQHPSVLHRISKDRARAPNEIVTRVRIPLPAEGEMFKLYKVSRRKDLDISSFGAAMWMRPVRPHDRGDSHRLRRRGSDGDANGWNRGAAAAANWRRWKYSSRPARSRHGGRSAPISDVRGSDEYRRASGREYSRSKFWHNLGDDATARIDGSPANAPAAGMRGFSVRRSPKRICHDEHCRKGHSARFGGHARDRRVHVHR